MTGEGGRPARRRRRHPERDRADVGDARRAAAAMATSTIDRKETGNTTMIKLSAFRWVPPLAQGLVRDVRVRWALEEAGIPYQEKLIGPEDQANAGYRALQPFGQVPAIETGDLKLFDSGAIVLHLAEGAEALMPSDAKGRARTRAWAFARSEERRVGKEGRDRRSPSESNQST